MKSLSFSVVYETKSGSNWSADVPDLPGCVSTGETLDDVKRNIREAMEGHLQVMREYRDPIPQPSTVVDVVELA
jgi:predicted RNase H-like HicB family nuclease